MKKNILGLGLGLVGVLFAQSAFAGDRITGYKEFEISEDGETVPVALATVKGEQGLRVITDKGLDGFIDSPNEADISRQENEIMTTFYQNGRCEIIERYVDIFLDSVKSGVRCNEGSQFDRYSVDIPKISSTDDKSNNITLFVNKTSSKALLFSNKDVTFMSGSAFNDEQLRRCYDAVKPTQK